MSEATALPTEPPLLFRRSKNVAVDFPWKPFLLRLSHFFFLCVIVAEAEFPDVEAKVLVIGGQTNKKTPAAPFLDILKFSFESQKEAEKPKSQVLK